VKDAREAVRVDMNQYQSGVVDLTTVVTAENTLLADEENELTVRQNLFLASVSLIEALGRRMGYDTGAGPKVQLHRGFSLVPQLESENPACRGTDPRAANAIQPVWRAAERDAIAAGNSGSGVIWPERRCPPQCAELPISLPNS